MIVTSGRFQHQKSTIHRHFIQSDKSHWLKMQNEYSAHAKAICSGQRSRFLVLTRRIAASGDENESNLRRGSRNIPKFLHTRLIKRTLPTCKSYKLFHSVLI